MSLSPRGQSSFELLLVVAAVISITVGVLAIAAKENSTTTALSIVKAQAINKLNENSKNYQIERIEYLDQNNGSAICFNVKTLPATYSGDTNFSETIGDVISATGYKGAAIRFNTACT